MTYDEFLVNILNIDEEYLHLFKDAYRRLYYEDVEDIIDEVVYYDEQCFYNDVDTLELANLYDHVEEYIKEVKDNVEIKNNTSQTTQTVQTSQSSIKRQTHKIHSSINKRERINRTSNKREPIKRSSTSRKNTNREIKREIKRNITSKSKSDVFNSNLRKTDVDDSFERTAFYDNLTYDMFDYKNVLNEYKREFYSELHRNKIIFNTSNYLSKRLYHVIDNKVEIDFKIDYLNSKYDNLFRNEVDLSLINSKYLNSMYEDIERNSINFNVGSVYNNSYTNIVRDTDVVKDTNFVNSFKLNNSFYEDVKHDKIDVDLNLDIVKHRYSSLRRTWKKEPRYAKLDRNEVKHTLNNVKRRVKYRLSKENLDYDVLESYKKFIERVNRSISHQMKYKSLDYNRMIAYDEDDLDEVIYNAYEDFAYTLVKQKMTDAQYEAFLEYTSTNNFDEFLEERYTGDLKGFVAVLKDLDDFISNEWYLYSEDALTGRLKYNNQILDKEQVAQLQNADRRYLDRADEYENLL